MALKDLKIPLVDAMYDKVNDVVMGLREIREKYLQARVWLVSRESTESGARPSTSDRLKAINERKKKDWQFISTLIKKKCHECLIRLGNQKDDPISAAIYTKSRRECLFHEHRNAGARALHGHRR